MPIFAVPLPVQSPAMGRSPANPNDFTHNSKLQFFHCPSPLRSRYQAPVEGRNMPIFAFPVAFHSPAMAKSPSLVRNFKQRYELQFAMPSPLVAKYHVGVRPKISSPILSSPDPFQSPMTGRAFGELTERRQRSIVHPSHLPLPLRSKNHSPVEGRNTPIFDIPVPVQFPVTGRSSGLPKGPEHRSTLHPSQMPLPFISRNHSPVAGRKIPIAERPCPRKVALTEVELARLTVQSVSP